MILSEMRLMSFLTDPPFLLLFGLQGIGKVGNFYFELRRKLFHLFFGLFLIFMLFYSGRINLIIFLCVFLFIGCIMILVMQKGWKIPIADWLEETFERKNVKFPGYGAFWYVVGALLVALFLGNAHEIAAAIVALAAGDSAATIFGILGTHPLPHNRRKTWEGSIAFFFFSLPACLFAGWIGIALAAIAAIVESLDTRVDDNLLIPVAAILFFILF
jgi:phytol kinase